MDAVASCGALSEPTVEFAESEKRDGRGQSLNLIDERSPGNLAQACNYVHLSPKRARLSGTRPAGDLPLEQLSRIFEAQVAAGVVANRSSSG